MSRITEALIRKRAEHNECIISTLEELSLHQQDIEKIEYLDKWCRELKILYLQSNLIPKIENIGRLKKLEYLNLALNNIERVENLEGCESLKKLDLTVNFVGELTSLECLKNSYHFEELYLTGNPCTDYEGYREYVIATLPQLKRLDGQVVEKSERIKAIQALPVVRDEILEQQARYKKKREKERSEGLARLEGKETETKKLGTDWYTETEQTGSGKDNAEVERGQDTEGKEKGDRDEEVEKIKEVEEKDKAFWAEKTAFTPESRLEVHKHMEEKRKREQKEYLSPDPPPRQRLLVNQDGRRMNVNEPKIDFELRDDEERGVFELDVAVFKHMDTSLCDVDVQTDYVIVSIKGKVLQLVLTEEVLPDSSTAKRSQTTGHLLVTMPKANFKPIIQPHQHAGKKKDTRGESKENNKPAKPGVSHERLEVDPTAHKSVELDKILSSETAKMKRPLGTRPRTNVEERPNSEGFVDDPDVPPLI